MKISRILIAALMVIAVFVFASCNKDNDKNPVSIEGKWVGSYSFMTGTPYYFSFNIKANGEIQELNPNGGVEGSGTWELDNATNVFSAHYTWTTGEIFSVVAAFDKNNGRLIGNW